MAATLAHEIRNPLAVLTNALAVLAQRPQSPGLQGMMRAEVDRMTELSEELLEFSRPRPALLRPTELQPLLEGVVAAAGAQAQAGVRIALEVAGALPEVNVDARLLRRALLNLLQNGAQATPSGTVTLRASTSDGEAAARGRGRGAGDPARGGGADLRAVLLAPRRGHRARARAGEAGGRRAPRGDLGRARARRAAPGSRSRCRSRAACRRRGRSRRSGCPSGRGGSSAGRPSAPSSPRR